MIELRLPNELWLMIISYCDGRTRLRTLTTVNKHLRQLVVAYERTVEVLNLQEELRLIDFVCAQYIVRYVQRLADAFESNLKSLFTSTDTRDFYRYPFEAFQQASMHALYERFCAIVRSCKNWISHKNSPCHDCTPTLLRRWISVCFEFL